MLRQVTRTFNSRNPAILTGRRIHTRSARPFRAGGLVLAGALTAGFLWFHGSQETHAADTSSEPKKKRIVILGAGWATVNLLKKLNPRMWEADNYEVVVVSPRNYFLFTPLLPGCTTGSLDNASITTPIRLILEGKKYAYKFHEALCTDVDPENNRITCRDPSGVQAHDFTVDYDYLVVAVGSEPATFGTKGVYEHAHFLKSITDATAIRSEIIDCFETAGLPGVSAEDRKALLSFVVVGGGPTGCEFAGELHDFLDQDVSRYFPELKKDVSISIIQSGEVILNQFDQHIAKYAQEKMSGRENMKILTNRRVAEVEHHSVTVVDKGTRESTKMPFGVCIWSTGVVPNALIRLIAAKIPGQTSRAGLLTDTCMKVKGTDNIYAIGDCSIIEQKAIAGRMAELFEAADVNKDGNLCYKEFKNWLKAVTIEYPQLKPLSSNLKEAFKTADMDGSGSLDKHEFELVLQAADAGMKNLPTTAQVAAQEGAYLGTEFKRMAKGKSPKPFKYRQLAQFAYIGKDNAIGEVPFFKGGGIAVFMMWKGVYIGYQQSWSNMLSVLFFWTKAYFLGRDVSRH